MAVLQTLGNILWFLFGGLAGGLAWALAGCLWCVTIVGIPIGLHCFKLAGLAFFPFGREVVYGGGGVSFIANVFWILFFWAGAGAWLPCSRLPVVHNHYRHTVWQAVLQNGAACAHAVRRIRAVNGAAARAFCPRALFTRFPAAELKYIFLSGCGQMVRSLLWERVTAS